MRNRRKPFYSDDTDYTTNSPSYYDDLARKQRLIQLLTEKIWDYDDEIKEYFKRWEDNLENINEDVIEMMIQWADDGTLDHIINDNILNWKADKTYVDSEIERLDQKDEDLTTQKADKTFVDSEIERLDQNNESLSTQLEQTGLNIWNYIHLIENRNEVTDENDWDWTPAIEQAIKDAAVKGGSKILFTHYGTGDYKMKPISFRGYKNIKLVGLGGQIGLNSLYLWDDENKPTNHVRFTFIEEGEVGLQFSNTGLGNEWKADFCTVENIWLNGNNMVDTCANGNYGIVFRQVMASTAIKDGITFEDYSYPALIENSQLVGNGRHGFHANGSMSTVYTLDRVNAGNNRGYGFNIEGGAGATFNDCLAHSNRIGGLKISKRNDLYGNVGSNYLEKLTFNNFYAEANGKVDSQDPNYEGNYAFVVDKVGTTNSTGRTNAMNIVFNGGSLNESQGGNSYLIDSVFGLTFDKLGVNHAKGKINVERETVGLVHSINTTRGFSKAPFPFISKHLERDKNKSIEVWENGGVISERGRVNVIPFLATELTSTVSKVAKPFGNTINEGFMPQGYPIKEGSLVGVKIVSAKGTGSVGVSILKGKTVGLSYFLQETITLNTANNFTTEIFYEPLEHKLTDEFVGIRVHPSSDYTSSTSAVIVYLLVEE